MNLFTFIPFRLRGIFLSRRTQAKRYDWLENGCVDHKSKKYILKKVESRERSREIDPVISTRRRRIVFPLRTRRDNVSVKL